MIPKFQACCYFYNWFTSLFSSCYRITDRGNWKRPIYGRLAIIGSVVGYGSLIYFPHLISKHGTNCLIPYLIVFVLVGVPLFALELIMGQYMNLGPIKAFSNLAPILICVGYGMVLISLTVVVFYNLYLTESLLFFVHHMLRLTGYKEAEVTISETCKFASDDTEPLSSSFYTKQMIAFLGSWLLVAFCISKGYHALGKVMIVLTLLPYLLMFTLFGLKVATQSPENSNFQNLFNVSLDGLFNGEIIHDSAKSALFSLGTAFGVQTTLASYNKRKHNCFGDAVAIPLIDITTSLLSTYLYYGLLKHGEEEILVILCRFSEIFNVEDGIAVTIYIIFCFIGFGSQLSMVEVVITAILDQFELLRDYQSCVVYIMCIVLFAVGLPTSLSHDMYKMLEKTNASVLFCFSFTLSFSGPFFYFQLDKVKRDMKVQMNRVLEIFFIVSWCFISPLLMTFLVGLHFLQVSTSYSTEEAVTVFAIVIFPVIITVINCWPLKFKEYFQPTQNFNTLEERSRLARVAEENERRNKNCHSCFNSGFQID